MANLPSGTVAFMFTDIEGSTRLWERHPDAMPAAYARHDAILRLAVAAHQGAVYKTIGDAFQIAFPSVPSAVAAAFGAQRALVVEPWLLPEPLRVRMALHVGDVDPDPDGDYRSPVLNRLGRLLAAGHGGQVLLSHAAFELARDSLPDGVAVRDLGERRLKDLYRPEHVHQILHPALPTDFPPLATLDRRPQNLPIQPTPLIGREAEIAAIRALLEQRDARLVTLTGPGGIGKTRLGLQVAAELVDAFNHGAFFVPLATIADPDLVPAAIAQALGIPEESDRPILDSVRDAVREREMLLLLDNFEQVLDGAPVAADLLAAAPGVKILTTSRARLRLRGEREVAVPPLAFPPAGGALPLERLTQYEAVRLFIARAQDARADFQVTNETAPAVAEICARLDGLPLAIELAAARVKLLPPPALLQRLERRLATLTGGARDLPERQRTLRAAIDWSYGLLAPDEQAMFRRLAVCVGGASLEAAEAVATAPPAPATDVFDLVASLVDKSLLRQEEPSSGDPRFSMLETIREFAAEQLDAGGAGSATRDAHMAHFLALAEQAEDELRGPDQGAWLDRLETDHDNLRAALAWSLDGAGDQVSGLRLAGALWRFWFDRGYLAEGANWLERALVAARDAPAEDRDIALTGAGSLAWIRGDMARAAAAYEETVALNRELGDAHGVAIALANLGIATLHLGDESRAGELLEESLAHLRDLEDVPRIAGALLNLAVVRYYEDDLPRAEALFAEGLGLYRDLGDRRGVANSLLNLGVVAHERGDDTRAAALLTESLTSFRELGDKRGIVATLDSIARVAPRPVSAARLFGATDALQAEIGAATPPRDRLKVEQAIAAVRAALDEASFAAAWEAGRSLSFEEAVAEALIAASGEKASDA